MYKKPIHLSRSHQHDHNIFFRIIIIIIITISIWNRALSISLGYASTTLSLFNKAKGHDQVFVKNGMWQVPLKKKREKLRKTKFLTKLRRPVAPLSLSNHHVNITWLAWLEN